MRHYFDVGVISYTTDGKGAPVIGPVLKGKLAGPRPGQRGRTRQEPLRIDEKVATRDDGEGGLPGHQ